MNETTQEKLTAIAENRPKIYENGRNDGIRVGREEFVSKSKYIPKQATGKVISLNDVSEVYHKVKVYGDGEVDVYGKNLFDGVLEIGAIYSDTGENVTTTASTRTVNYIPILPNTTYTISREITNQNIRTRFYDKDKNYIEYGFSGTNSPKTFTTKDNYCYMRLELAGGTVDEKIQVEFGNATPYEPYNKQTIISTPNGTEANPLCPNMTFLADSDITVDYYGSYGMNEERIRFWGNYLNFGNVKELYLAFGGYAWNERTFNPLYDINASNSSQMFTYSYIQDLRGILQRNGVSLIFNDTKAGYTQHFSVFRYSKIKYLPYLRMPTTSSAYGWFENCTELEEIDGLYVNQNNLFQATSGTNKTFQNCSKLTHCIFSGVIANDINLQWSPLLDDESLVSLVETLRNLFDDMDLETGDIPYRTLTLHADCWNRLKSMIYPDPPHWEPRTYYDVIMNKGWNVA